MDVFVQMKGFPAGHSTAVIDSNALAEIDGTELCWQNALWQLMSDFGLLRVDVGPLSADPSPAWFPGSQ